MALFLNPSLIQQLARHLKLERERGRSRVPGLGDLVLLLNACHAAAVRGEVRVSQAYLASRCGDVSPRSIRAWEAELVAAGLLERVSLGQRRMLTLPGEPSNARPGAESGPSRSRLSTGSPQVVHNQRLPTLAAFDGGTVVPVVEEPPRRYRPKSPAPPNKDRARVSQRLLQEPEGPGPLASPPISPSEALASAARALARTTRAGPTESREIGEVAVQLAVALGTHRATLALGEIGPWAVKRARANPAGLAVEAARARVRHAKAPVSVQRSLFA